MAWADRVALDDGENTIVAIKRYAQCADFVVNNSTSSLHSCITVDKVDRDIFTKCDDDVKFLIFNLVVRSAELKRQRHLSSSDKFGVIMDNPRHHDRRVCSSSQDVDAIQQQQSRPSGIKS